jgi:hypothetical protein
MISITATMLLVLAFSVTDAHSFYNKKTIPQDSFSAYHGAKLPELKYYDNYEELRSTSNTVVIYPIFTQSAYDWGGIYNFYVHSCDTCITVEIQDFYEKFYTSSGNGFRILEFLGYEIIDDIDIDKNPEILKKYDKVILLHSEYVTRAEFEAITNHPNVVYLYPNALSSEITADYSSNTISLVRGPGYPEKSIINGFDWEFDNSQYFDDWDCMDWEFYQVENGHMLNCYPETELPLYGYEIMRTLKTL